tara:strand:- start:13337 stop:14863 length:1527 start_codon:yes stop_codon:yes gene_type:complete
MAVLGKAGALEIVQFVLYQADGVTPLLNAVAAVTTSLFRDGQQVNNLNVEVIELGGGQYVARFTPDTKGTYVLNIDHELQAWTETINVYDVDLDDLDAAISNIVASSDSNVYAVSIANGPWNVNEQLSVTILFRVIDTLSAFNPSVIDRVEFISTNGNDVIQTVQGANLQHPALGQYQASFNAVANTGSYYVRTYFTPVAGAAQTFSTNQLDVTDLATEVIAGIFSVDALLRDFLGVLPGVADPFRLLEAENVSGVYQRVVPDEMIAAEIRREAAYLSLRLETPLTTRRYACRPDVKMRSDDPNLVKGVDYDEEVDPLDMQWPHRGAHFGVLSFQHANVTKITKARLLYGQTVLYEVPARWLNLNRRQGIARVIVDSSNLNPSESHITYAATWGYLVDYWGGRGRRWPMLWAIDYEAGLPSVSEPVKTLVGWRTVARVLSLAARRANPTAVQSQTAGKDGLSRSFSISDSGPGGRFAALLDQKAIQEWLSEERIMEMKALIHGSIGVF